MISGPVDPARHTFRSPQLKSLVQEAVQFLAGTPIHALPPGMFTGVGVYLLYYLGPFEPYTHIARHTQQTPIQPIYAGKAVPPGWRTARSIRTGEQRALYQRLREHAGSIDSVPSLEVQDFQCRFLILDDPETDLISAVEAVLIRTYNPLWNAVVDGFGNHAPGGGRSNQAPSEWDVLHPGRTWVERLTGRPPRREKIIAKIQRHSAQAALDFS